MYKKLHILISSLFVIFILPLSINADEKNRNYIDSISNSSDFSDNKLIVVLTDEVSLNKKQYSKYDFSEYGCINVEDLTSTATKTMLYNLQNDFVDIENYNRILCVELNKNSKENVLNVIEELSKRDDVIYAGPDYKLKICSTIPNDPYINDQWALDNIKLPQAWNYSVGSSDVIVGVIDTGIDSSHPELSSKLIDYLCRDFSSGQEIVDDSPYDIIGHGTHVAGIIGGSGNNNVGVCGTNWNVGLVSLKIYDDEGNGYSSSFYKAVNYAQSKKIPILNFSSTFVSGNFDQSILTYITSYSGLLICSAGNEGQNIDNYPIYPACYDSANIITVGSLDSDNNKSNFSNYGINNVDIYAPGGNILSTYPTALCEEFDYTFYDGTRLCELSTDLINALLIYMENNDYSWDDVNEQFSNIPIGEKKW